MQDMAKAHKVSWNEMDFEVVNEHMRRKIITGARMTLAHIFFDDGFLVPCHAHENEQITQVIQGLMRFTLGEDQSETIDVGPGEAIVIPPNVPHAALVIGNVEEFDFWSPRREDWLNKTDAYLRG